MAFGTIEWNGAGTVSYCDGLTDTAGGTWAEDGGGGISYNTDQYLTGAGSIGHVYASKSGFGSYAASTSYDFTADSSGTGTVKVPGQKLYVWLNYSSSSAFDILANNGFAWVVGSDTSNHRNFKLSGSDDNNGWSTGWKLFVIDPLVGDAAMDVGTYDPGNVSHWGLWMDTIVSVRADTVFIDRVAIAHGLRVVDGTGTMEDIVTWCAKSLATRAWGVFQYRGRFIYSAGSLTVGDSTNQTANTQLTSTGSKIGYEISEYYHDTNGWSLSHPAAYNEIILEKHASYTTDFTASNTGMYGDTAATLAISNDAGATLNHVGGELEELTAITMNVDQDISNVVLSDCGTRAIEAGTFTGNTVNTSDVITVTSSSIFNGNTISKSISTASVVASDLGHAPSNTFVSDGSNHAIELTSIGGGSMIWSCESTGYETGSSGTPVTPTSTGNEDIFVNVATGDITINVTSGTIPSIRSAGATVTIPASSYTLTMTNIIEGTVLTIVNSSTRAVLKAPITVGASGEATYSHAGGEIVDILLLHLNYDPNLSDIYDLTLPSSDSALQFSMIDDPNYENN